jgi:hypothetical protein
MNRERTLEWEGRWALPAALCAFGAAALFIAGTVASQQGVVSADTDVEYLRDFYDVRGTMLLTAALNTLGLFAFAPPLYYLFRAASARSASVRRGLVGVVIAGPVFLGVAGILQWVAFNGAATDFHTPGGGAGVPIGEYANDLLQDQTAYGLAQGLSLAGILGFVVAVIYTALWAMRVGLVTRFFGTFGMALGASLVLLAQGFSLLALMMWMVWLGLIYIGRVPGGRPRAWDAGEAIPWPKPGEQAAEPPPADAEVLDGEATELGAEAENPNAARRERAKKRKRKRRQ